MLRGNTTMKRKSRNSFFLKHVSHDNGTQQTLAALGEFNSIFSKKKCIEEFKVL